MTIVEELTRKVPQMTVHELTEFRDWLERYVEDRMELRDEVKSELDEAWAEIEKGNYRIRPTPAA